MKIDNQKIIPQKNGIGVKVNNIDISSGVSSEQTIQIQKLLEKYRVVIFPNQNLKDKDLESFAFRFGPPFVPDNKFPVLGSNDKASSIVIVGNQAHEYKKAYLGYQEVLPHSDHQWLRCPSATSMLYAIDIDKEAASTIWTDMVKAYELLDDEIRKTIEDLKIITFNPFYRPFGSVSAKYVNRKEDIPPGDTFPHPLVRTHPKTMEKILYMHSAYEMEFVGISYKEGLSLFSHLTNHINSVQCIYEHHWRKGDLVMWDNQATLHYRPAFGENIRRVLKRVTVGGGIPF